MFEILSEIRNRLEDTSGKHIFLSYDTVPVRDKGEIFNVLSMDRYEATNPIYSGTSAYMPVKCEITLTVFAPVNTSAEQLYDYYYSNFDTAINDLCGLYNRLKSLETVADNKLNRLTLKSTIEISCIKIFSEQEG